MAAENEKKFGDEIKCLLIANISKIVITLYVYVGWAPKCKISTISKLIKPSEGHLYHQKKPFKFKIVAKSPDDKKAKIVLGPEEWKENSLIIINESLECQTERFAQIENATQLCHRKIHREEELAPGDLYDILGLNMEDVRKMSKEDAKKAIAKAFKKQMRIWHPDKNFGDKEIAQVITRAKEILMDDEKRARYHNEIDYSKGWFSKGRWKACFSPDCYTKEQRKEFRKRISMLIASFVFITGGIALSVATAGAATPAVIAGGIFGAGFTGAGFQSLGHTLNKKSVLHRCKLKSWGCKALIGFLGGAITGGAAVAITAGVVGIGSNALELSAVSICQYLKMGASTGTVGGIMSSLSSDLARKLVDKETIKAKQVFFRVIFGSFLGACTGIVGALVTKGIVDSRASAATSALEGDTVEQVSAVTGGRRVANAVAHNVSKRGCMAATRRLLEILTNIVNERLDDSVGNQNIMKHFINGIKNIGLNVAQIAYVHAVGTFLGQGINESMSDEESYRSNDEARGITQVLGNEEQGDSNENGESNNRTNEKEEDDDSEEHMGAKTSHFHTKKERTSKKNLNTD